MPFTIHLTGDEEYRRKLTVLQGELNNLENFWPLLVPIVGGWMKDQFESEGAWGGASWSPLSPAYALEKARTHPGRTILIRDGTLRRAASEMRREVTPRSLVMWVDDPVAAYHQTGGENLPARPLIPDPLPESAHREIDAAALEYVSVLVRRIGL